VSTPEQALIAAHDAQDAWAHAQQGPEAAAPAVPSGEVPGALDGLEVTDRTDPRVAGPFAVDLPPVPGAESKHTGGSDAGYLA
jgi:hypothetical protein